MVFMLNMPLSCCQELKHCPPTLFFFSFVKFGLLLLLLTAKKNRRYRLSCISSPLIWGRFLHKSYVYFFTIFPTFLYFFLLKTLKAKNKRNETKQHSCLVLFFHHRCFAFCCLDRRKLRVMEMCCCSC